MEILPRFLAMPTGSFFLLGPRGTGKTTWLRDRLCDALFVNLLRPEVYREMAARPERLRELVAPESTPDGHRRRRGAACAGGIARGA